MNLYNINLKSSQELLRDILSTIEESKGAVLTNFEYVDSVDFVNYFNGSLNLPRVIKEFDAEYVVVQKTTFFYSNSVYQNKVTKMILEGTINGTILFQLIQNPDIDSVMYHPGSEGCVSFIKEYNEHGELVKETEFQYTNKEVPNMPTLINTKGG